MPMMPMPRYPLRPADPVSRRNRLPELADAGYVSEVFGWPDGTTEADIEEELMAKAAKLGITLPEHAKRSNAHDRTASAADSPIRAGSPGSPGSDGIADAAAMTSQTSDHATPTHEPSSEPTGRRRSRSLNFSQYDKYISQLNAALGQAKFPQPHDGYTGVSAGAANRPGPRKGVKGFTRSLASRLRGRQPINDLPMPCICCRELFATGSHSVLHTLPCGHKYCRDCLAVVISQSLADECKMPPKCCTEPIPSAIIKLVLPRDKQQEFLKAVVLYSTPWETRIFCPKASCGEFIPPATRVDPKHPSEVLCAKCKTRVCIMCKRAAHQLGQDCPEDHELERVLKMGEKSGWRRCYKCRMLVELAQGCTHITCRCKAQFCYICGAVWDPAVGCPNFCNGEEELERRRVEEEARLAEIEAEKMAQEKAAEAEDAAKQEAERRTLESSEFRALRAQLEAEMARFKGYEQKVQEAMRERQSIKKLALVDKFSDLTDKMRDRHARTEQHLEDRQVMAEIELQSQLEEKEKKVRLKLKYMEDYCHGHGAGPAKDHDDKRNTSSGSTDENGEWPQRQVTERDLEQLRQQYLVRDGMEQRHRSQIHGLREKQAKSMEELMERHEREMEALLERRAEEIEDLAVAFANEEDVLQQTFAERRARLLRRWELAAEILRVEMERRYGKPFAALALPAWPETAEDGAGGGEDVLAAGVAVGAVDHGGDGIVGVAR
ncbi:29167a57-e23a-40dd-9b98-6c3be238cb5a [Thermothielavioides terrestris]|uniref:RBR-type E3 ubiquitin transferase n=1 Tax=Thermothielavioides terrestris TaxID=2587410 RepID=A0A446BAN8_9PEZI|nr:29167a57-e23a-40dd-9b98-6c3be238cb5a [Thermothielavioides terrestris]